MHGCTTVSNDLIYNLWMFPEGTPSDKENWVPEQALQVICKEFSPEKFTTALNRDIENANNLNPTSMEGALVTRTYIT